MADQQSPRTLSSFEKEVHLSDYLNVLLRRWRIAAIVFALVFLGTALYTFLATPLFEAYATVAGAKGVPGQHDEGTRHGHGEHCLTTEIEVLQSDAPWPSRWCGA